MRRPSGESRTTEQKSPVARDICSATIASRASMFGTASLNASEAAEIEARRPESTAGGPVSPEDTVPLYARGAWIQLPLSKSNDLIPPTNQITRRPQIGLYLRMKRAWTTESELPNSTHS